ncbi:membrane protein insertion efficiency factor YidD [Patescibacteria group bacterium]|nr:membrane protein insertion efficiency factor YidD [Patescibacteria group bacterium]
MSQKIILKLIKFYQSFISPFLGRNCRFYPSCSEYAKLSIKKYGVFKGMIFSFWRILRCHPYGKGGVDIP